VRARVAWFSLDPERSPIIVRHRRADGRAYGLRDGRLVEWDEGVERVIAPVAEVPVTLGGLARYNVANALAAAAGARAIGVTIEQVADGLRDFRPSAALSPGRLNLFRVHGATVIVDFAHNEAGTEAILDVAAGLAARVAGAERVAGAGRSRVTAIIGTAGDRPDDTLAGIGRIAAGKADRIIIKETLDYLRGRDRAEIVSTILEGVAAGGMDPATVPIHETETGALEAELTTGDPVDDGRVIVLFCHAERDAVFALLDRLGALPVVDPIAPG
jgi:cyanophycin synthetase